MASAGQERIIIGLVGIPVVVTESIVHATDVSVNAGNASVGAKRVRHYSKRRVRGEGIQRAGLLKINYGVPVVTDARGIGQRRAENVIFFQSRNLTRGRRLDGCVIKL